ncbi:MAG TPA: replicative DNA helicase [Anaerolineaceae bacterium]|nr:replicative DNA helicase [Chloroflexota bacterium]HNY83504.1 replicative DNA helicase [Anaerolineaceae bacterium]
MSESPFDTTATSDLTPGLLYDRDMEEALIGSVLINPDVFIDVAPILKPEDFFLNRHQWIWQAYQELFNERQDLDQLTLKDRLESAGHLEDVGGMDYLFSLSNQVPSSLHAESYAHAINGYATRRRMLNAANEIAKLAYRKDYDVEFSVEEAEKAILSVSQNRYKRDLQPIKRVVDQYMDRVLLMSGSTDATSGLSTGLPSLDKILDGLQRSDFLIVAGRPGMGKSGFLIGIAKHVGLELKRSVAVFTLEMSAEQLLQRMLAMETDIDSQKLRSARLSDSEQELAQHAMTILSDARIYIDDTPAITPLQMRTKCTRLQMEEGLDLVIVDYLQLMAGDLRTENRVQEVSYISRYLKVMAKELNVPVIAAAQLNRGVEQRQDKTPVLSDLRESGSLEQDADIVMFINRPDAGDEKSENRNLAKLAVAKHRNGPTHPGIDLVFLERLAMFGERHIERGSY